MRSYLRKSGFTLFRLRRRTAFQTRTQNNYNNHKHYLDFTNYNNNTYKEHPSFRTTIHSNAVVKKL